MPASRVYLFRHGDSRQDDVKRYLGQSDHPLNPAGLAQAEFWRTELATLNYQRIVSSDLCRSFDTARIIAAGRGLSVERYSGLREINLGAWEGLAVEDLRRQQPDEYERRGDCLADHCPPDGESFNDLAGRVLPLFDDLVKSASGNLLIVGHAGVNRVILSQILGRPRTGLFEFRQEYGCLNIIYCSEGGLCARSINITPDKEAVAKHIYLVSGQLSANTSDFK